MSRRKGKKFHWQTDEARIQYEGRLFDCVAKSQRIICEADELLHKLPFWMRTKRVNSTDCRVLPPPCAKTPNHTSIVSEQDNAAR